MVSVSCLILGVCEFSDGENKYKTSTSVWAGGGGDLLLRCYESYDFLNEGGDVAD